MDRLFSVSSVSVYTIASYDSSIHDSHSDAAEYKWGSKSIIKKGNKSKFQVSAVR